MRDHLAISQISAGAPTQRRNFPLRNRTMALISDATVIIEATDESDFLHQGWEALRLGRPLFIAKSILDRPGVTWPAKMMEYGARILSDETLPEFEEALPARMSVHDGCLPF